MLTQRQQRVVLAVLSLAAFMASLDVFIVNVAFDAIGRDFHGASLPNLSWILNGYAIVFAALLVPAAGSPTASAGSGCSSPGCWCSPPRPRLRREPRPLVARRVPPAAGRRRAALTPTSLGLLVAATPPTSASWPSASGRPSAASPQRSGRCSAGCWSPRRGAGCSSSTCGRPRCGVVALRVVPDSKDASVTRIPDVLGASVLTGTIALLSLALVKGGDWGWGSAKTVGCFVVAAGLAAWFSERSVHHHTPIIELALVRVRTFGYANLAMLLFSIGFAASLLINILWVQNVWHYSAVRTGFAVAPGPTMVPFTTLLIRGTPGPSPRAGSRRSGASCSASPR